jgi:hypothetical protein
VEAALTIGKLRIVQLEAPLIHAVSDLYWQVRIAAVRQDYLNHIWQLLI